MKKILVTGALGYLGSVLCPYLKQNGYDVIGLDTGFFKDSQFFPSEDPEIIPADMREFKPEYLNGIDAVIHLAAISNDPFGNLSFEKIYEPTRRYALDLAQHCKKRGIKFIFPSSCSVYGQGGGGVLSETSAANPQTPYSLNKLQIEGDLVALSDASFRPIMLRFATVYGPSARIRFDLVINMLTALAFTQKEIILNSDGLAWRPHLHIQDVCQAFHKALDFSPKSQEEMIFNIGDDSQNFQIITVAEMIRQKVAGSEIKFMHKMKAEAKDLDLVKDRKIQDGVDKRTYQVSFVKAKTVLGFNGQWVLDKGIDQLLAEFKRVGLTKDEFLQKKYYRLQQIEYLHQNGFIDDDLFLDGQGKGLTMLKFATKNLMVRVLRPSDITDAYIRSLNDPEVVQFTGAQFTRWNKTNVKAYVKSSNVKDKSILLGIFLKLGDTHIGNIRLFNFDKHHDRVELGIMIFDKTQWGKGYATESLAAVCDYVFRTLKLHRICADYYSVNKASGHMFKKAGFKVEGIFKDHFVSKGRYVDSVRVAKLK